MNVEQYQIKPVVLDPDSFNPNRGILTRYGKKLIEEGAKYYSKITIPLDFEEPRMASEFNIKVQKYRRIDDEWCISCEESAKNQ